LPEAIASPDLRSVQDNYEPAPPARAEIAAWKKVVADFEKPCAWRATWQLGSTLSCYLATWTAIYFAREVSYLLVLPLALLASGFLIRLFIIFHDCCHHSFYKKKGLNQWLGFFTGTLAFTPFKHWRWEHSVHHATAGDLDRRGVGDIWTLTVKEYMELSRWDRLVYRMVRNPVILFGIAPIYIFLVRERRASPRANQVTRKTVKLTNLALLCMIIIGCLIFGILPYILIQVAIMAGAASAGVWLFYVQHQFEGVYWERHEHWEYTSAALEGSSFYRLPRVLQWFTGNIGYHHVHHLSSKIPNYRLEACHNSHPEFIRIKPITMFGSFKSLGYRLWDETDRVLIGWRRMREIRKMQEQAAAVNPITG
jgi:omega-6 fatty acid desaturase (delta-12 desaturase)